MQILDTWYEGNYNWLKSIYLRLERMREPRKDNMNKLPPLYADKHKKTDFNRF
jgi:hypothetical protein